MNTMIIENRASSRSVSDCAINAIALDEPQPHSGTPSLRSVLVVVDERTRPSSLGIVKRLVDKFGCCLEVLCVSNEVRKLDEMLSSVLSRDDYAQDIYDYHLAHAENLVGESALRDVDELNVVVRHGVGFVEVINEAADRFDLIIRYSDRSSSADDAHLIRKCPVPVWILDNDSLPDVRQILVPVKLTADRPDLKNLNHRIIQQALSLARAFDARLHFLSVINDVEIDTLRLVSAAKLSAEQLRTIRSDTHQVYENRLQALADEVMAIAKELDLSIPSFESIAGNPSTLIPETAKRLDTDVVVMGSVGRLEVPGLLIGNTAESVLPSIPCSLLTVKPAGFRSPVLESRPTDVDH